MKSKVTILLIISAIVTLSFTFSSLEKDTNKAQNTTSKKEVSDEPAGGFVSEDKF